MNAGGPPTMRIILSDPMKIPCHTVWDPLADNFLGRLGWAHGQDDLSHEHVLRVVGLHELTHQTGPGCHSTKPHHSRRGHGRDGCHELAKIVIFVQTVPQFGFYGKPDFPNFSEI